MASTTIPADKSKPYFPLSGMASDGWSTEDEATATCLCGAVQLSFVSFDTRICSSICSALTPTRQPTSGPGLIGVFRCNCADCHKITASMFATNFTIADSYLKHLRGRENLKTFGQNQTVFFKTPGKDNTMTNYFCSTCGTLMYRVGANFPDMSILRVGTVDDFSLHETKLKPTMEQFTKDRVGWCPGIEGVPQFYEDGLHA